MTTNANIGEMTYRQVVLQVELQAASKRIPHESIDAAVAACTGLVASNGYELKDPVELDFVNRLSRAVVGNDLSRVPGLLLPNSSPTTRSAVEAFLHAYRTLASSFTSPTQSDGTPASAHAAAADSPMDVERNSEVTAVPGIKITWQNVLDQIRRQALVKGNQEDSIKSTLDACSSLIVRNGYELGDAVDPEFIRRVAVALAGGDLKQDPGLSLPNSPDSAFRSRIKAMIRAYEALSCTSFSERLRQLLKTSGIKYADVASQAGLKVTQIKTWLANCEAGVVNMMPEQATALDRILGADGQLVCTYAAMTQLSVYEPIPSITDEILGRIQFPQKLREYRRGVQWIRRELLDEVEKLSGIRLLESQLSHWEQGLNLPSKMMRKAILALDRLYGAKGELMRAWEAADPRDNFSAYTLPYEEWPKSLQELFDRLVRYKTTNPEGLPESDAPSSDRWTGKDGGASKIKFQEFCEHFFGYLVSEDKLEPAPLAMEDILSFSSLATKLHRKERPIDEWVVSRFSSATREALAKNAGLSSDYAATLDNLLRDLNNIIHDSSIYEAARFSGVALRPETKELLLKDPKGNGLLRLNHLLLQDSYHLELVTKERRPVLSLTLLCDWTLVQGYFDFVRHRAKREKYSLDAKTTTRTLINLYRYFLPHLKESAERESYWVNRTPTVAKGEYIPFAGVVRRYEEDLRNWEERWGYQCFLAGEKARAFLKERKNKKKFEAARMNKKVLPLLEAKITLAQILSVFEKRVHALPARILCRKAAIYLRRLAIAALMLARSFRPGTIEKLMSDMVTIEPDGKIHLDIPEEYFKNRGNGGSEGGVQGELPNCECLHVALRRYLEEGRPFLLGSPELRDGKDEGYLFTPAFSLERASREDQAGPGGPLGDKLLGHDAIIVLGYRIYSERYLFATDAARNKATSDQTGDAMQSSGHIVDMHYTKEAPLEKNARVNQLMESLLQGKPLNGPKAVTTRSQS
jgi:hypothetical protein